MSATPTSFESRWTGSPGSSRRARRSAQALGTPRPVLRRWAQVWAIWSLRGRARLSVYSGLDVAADGYAAAYPRPDRSHPPRPRAPEAKETVS
jgi:hypothetical protein